MRPFDVEPEYVALVEPDTLEPVAMLSGEALLALAARVGEVRLIDNELLAPALIPTSQPLEGEAIATCSA
jgi:pantoate--beta-alanine ligase